MHCQFKCTFLDIDIDHASTGRQEKPGIYPPKINRLRFRIFIYRENMTHLTPSGLQNTGMDSAAIIANQKAWALRAQHNFVTIQPLLGTPKLT